MENTDKEDFKNKMKTLLTSKEKNFANLDKELNKIFHPQRFDHRQLNPSDESNVDEGAQFFYASNLPPNELETISEDELSRITSQRPFYERSVSFQSRPFEDHRLQKSTSQITFEFEEEKIKSAHNQDVYPQNHPIITRVQRSKLLKRASTDNCLSNKGTPSALSDSFRKKADLYKIPNIKEKHGDHLSTVQDSSREMSESQEPFSTPILSHHELCYDSDDRRVSFSVGHEEDEISGSDIEKRTYKTKKKKKHRSHKEETDISLRRRRGSELKMTEDVVHISDEDLAVRDVCEIASHRGDHFRGLSRHKIHRFSSDKPGISTVNRHISKDIMDSDNQLVQQIYGVKKEFDHSPHSMFVEMDELHGEEWIEMARWIKYEEDREEGSERWGKPHVSSLSFHSLINLRLCLESAVLMLDFVASDLPEVMYRVVEEFGVSGDTVTQETKSIVLQKLLYRHKYVVDKHTFKFGNKRLSTPSLSKTHLDMGRNGNGSFKVLRRYPNIPRNELLRERETMEGLMDDKSSSNKLSRNQSDNLLDTSVDYLMISGFDDSSDEKRAQNERDGILKRIKVGTEGTIVLVGSMEDISSPLVALVRLSEGVIMPNILEVSIPVRFIFILLTPKCNFNMDCHEMGRSFSTLMSYPKFHNTAYRLEERNELLSCINEFLDESVVLPPGDWKSKNLLSIQEIQEIRRKKKIRQETLLTAQDLKAFDSKVPKESHEDFEVHKTQIVEYDPLQRTPYVFGGLYNDIKKRYPFYWSDIKDGLKLQCISTIIFIYFASLSGAIAFGGLLGDLTKNYIGISETLIVTCLSGVVFALFAGAPLIIIGVTGPVLLFDDALYSFTKKNDIEFLSWRTWIGIWLVIISLVVAALQLSTLVKYFTKFTKDIFSSLVCIIFIYEAIRKIVEIFMDHPLMSIDKYCAATNTSLDRWNEILNETMQLKTSPVSLETEEVLGTTMTPTMTTTMMMMTVITKGAHVKEPNTALLSLILMLGTFLIAYFLRIFRNSKFLGRTIRRALGDFGVPIAIIIMVGVDYSIRDTYTKKLNVPVGLEVTDSTKRGWFISPIGLENSIPVWACFAAVLPAILLYLLIVMETSINELITIERTGEKGAGLHLDLVLLSLLNCGAAFIGGPWICAATVRTVAHISALTVMSTTHAPGESPKVVAVVDQRLTPFMVALLIGLSVLLSPMLQIVPYSVIFGVFLYMGISSINGIQLFDRLFLFLLPVKHHPPVSYVRKVKTWKMHLYTIVQTSGLVILWIVKSTQASLAFPFFVFAMIPYRLSLKFFYSPQELNALDGPKAGQLMTEENEEPDFYEQGHK